MLIVRPLKYSLRVQDKVKKQISTLTINQGQNKKEREVTIKSSPFFVCWLGSMGCKMKHTTKPRCKIQISRNIKSCLVLAVTKEGIALVLDFKSRVVKHCSLYLGCETSKQDKDKKDVILQGAFFRWTYYYYIEK